MLLQRDRVRPAGKSMQMAVENQDHCSTDEVLGAPLVPILVNQVDGGGQIADREQFTTWVGLSCHGNQALGVGQLLMVAAKNSQPGTREICSPCPLW